MKTVVRLEAIGDNWRHYARAVRAGTTRPRHLRDEINIIRYGQQRHRPWIAQITGLDEHYGFRREFMRGPRDYTHADRMGERGIYEYFYLDDGLYEINEPTGLGRSHRYFARIENSQLSEIPKEELLACLCLNECSE